MITPGVAVYGTPGCAGNECDIFSFDRNIKTPYMENYNFNIQQQITNKVVLQVGYVGPHGHRLFRFFDINQPNQPTITASDIANANATPGCVVGGIPVSGPHCILDFGVPRNFTNAPPGAI